jgi:hypothetical protein
MILLILAAAVLTSSGQTRVLARLRAAGPQIKTWTAYIVILVGTWFIVLAVFADFFADVFPV